MNRLLVLALPLLAVACATTPTTTATPQWLVGTWLMMDEATSFPDGCSSDLPVAYSADGTYAFFDERGTWRLDGSRLTETLTEGGEPGDDRGPTVTRIEPAGPDSFVKHWPDSEPATFRRCPPSE